MKTIDQLMQWIERTNAIALVATVVIPVQVALILNDAVFSWGIPPRFLLLPIVLGAMELVGFGVVWCAGQLVCE